jgi:hypothetical protein
VGTVGTSYRNRLLLVPHGDAVAEHPSAGPDVEALRASGWELVSSTISEDGDDLLVFRHPIGSAGPRPAADLPG